MTQKNPGVTASSWMLIHDRPRFCVWKTYKFLNGRGITERCTPLKHLPNMPGIQRATSSGFFMMTLCRCDHYFAAWWQSRHNDFWRLAFIVGGQAATRRLSRKRASGDNLRIARKPPATTQKAMHLTNWRLNLSLL